MPLDQRVPSVDGLALQRNGALIMITNSVAGVGTEAARLVRSRDGWRHASMVETLPWPDRAPTTIASTPSGAYVSSSRLDRLLAGDASIERFTLRRVPPAAGRRRAQD